jgi:hypothetical protein
VVLERGERNAAAANRRFGARRLGGKQRLKERILWLLLFLHGWTLGSRSILACIRISSFGACNLTHWSLVLALHVAPLPVGGRAALLLRLLIFLLILSIAWAWGRRLGVAGAGLGTFHRDPQPEALHVDEHQDRRRNLVRGVGVEEHPDRAVQNRERVLIHHAWPAQHLGTLQQQVNRSKHLGNSRKMNPDLGESQRGLRSRSSIRKKHRVTRYQLVNAYGL